MFFVHRVIFVNNEWPGWLSTHQRRQILMLRGRTLALQDLDRQSISTLRNRSKISYRCLQTKYECRHFHGWRVSKCLDHLHNVFFPIVHKFENHNYWDIGSKPCFSSQWPVVCRCWRLWANNVYFQFTMEGLEPSNIAMIQDVQTLNISKMDTIAARRMQHCYLNYKHPQLLSPSFSY